MPGEMTFEYESTTLPTMSEGTVNLSSLVSKRFGALTSSPSKETLQSLARWILFHRAHPVILSSLTGLFDSSNSSDAMHQTSSSASLLPRKLVFLNVIHEILVADSVSDTIMWQKYHPFRVAVGEMVLLPILDSIRYHLKTTTSSETVSQIEKMSERLKVMKEAWKEVNCFESPTLLDDIIKVLLLIDKEIVAANKKNMELADSSQLSTEVDEPNHGLDTSMDSGQHEEEEQQQQQQEDDYSFGQADPSDDFKVSGDDHANLDFDEASCGTYIEETLDEGHEELPTVSEGVNIPSRPEDSGKTSLLPMKRKVEDSDHDNLVNVGDSSPNLTFMEQDDSPIVDELDYQSIPFGKIEIHELDIPNKAIATMQITRDLHGESTTRLSALISSIPQSIFDTCLAIKESNTTVADALKSLDVQALPDEFLDVDVDQALDSLRLYKNIIAKQKEARKKCIELLIKSQGEIGFSCLEAAKLYYTMDSKLTFLNKRKEMIRDAMELEGLDFDATLTEISTEADDDGQREFSWFQKGEMTH